MTRGRATSTGASQPDDPPDPTQNSQVRYPFQFGSPILRTAKESEFHLVVVVSLVVRS